MQDMRPPSKPPPARLQTATAASVYNGSNSPAAPAGPKTHPPPPADDSSEPA